MQKYLKFNKIGHINKKNGVDWSTAPDIKKRIDYIITSLELSWLKKDNIYCFRSRNSSARAYARIWGLSKIWQKALKKNPSYIIEVLSEKFDSLPENRQDEVLIHEIAHIPKNFSGSLLPHIKKRGKRNFNQKVKNLILMHKSKG